MEIDIENLKKELKEELREEMMNEFKMKENVYIKRQVGTLEIRKKYHNEIFKKFGSTGTIEDAIRYVAIYSMGYRKIASIPYKEKDKFNEQLEKLYKFVLGEENL